MKIIKLTDFFSDCVEYLVADKVIRWEYCERTTFEELYARAPDRLFGLILGKAVKFTTAKETKIGTCIYLEDGIETLVKESPEQVGKLLCPTFKFKKEAKNG